MPTVPRAVTPCFTTGMFEAARLEDVSQGSWLPSPFPGVRPWFRSLLQTNSYSPLTPQGHPPLVKVLAQFFEKLLGRDLDPMTNVMVTVGAYQALFCCFQAFVDEGDEVSQDLGLLHWQPSPRGPAGWFLLSFSKAKPVLSPFCST